MGLETYISMLREVLKTSDGHCVAELGTPRSESDHDLRRAELLRSVDCGVGPAGHASFGIRSLPCHWAPGLGKTVFEA